MLHDLRHLSLSRFDAQMGRTTLNPDYRKFEKFFLKGFKNSLVLRLECYTVYSTNTIRERVTEVF